MTTPTPPGMGKWGGGGIVCCHDNHNARMLLAVQYCCWCMLGSGLAVKEKRWGKTGYNKEVSPITYETTPTSQETTPSNVLEATSDSRHGDEEHVDGHGMSGGGGDSVTMVRATLMVKPCVCPL